MAGQGCAVRDEQGVVEWWGGGIQHFPWYPSPSYEGHSAHWIQWHTHAHNANIPTVAPNGMRDPWPWYFQTVIKGRQCIMWRGAVGGMEIEQHGAKGPEGPMPFQNRPWRLGAVLKSIHTWTGMSQLATISHQGRQHPFSQSPNASEHCGYQES